MRFIKPILILLAGLCIVQPLPAQPNQPIYQLNAGKSIHNLKEITGILVDSSNKIPDKEIIAGRFDGQFYPLKRHTNRFKEDVTYWLQFNITSTTSLKDWWLLLVAQDRAHYYAQHGYVDVYQVNARNSSFRHSKTGMFVPYSERSVKDLPSINRVWFSMNAGDTQKIYLRVYNLRLENVTTIPTPELRDSSIPIPIHEDTITLIPAIGISLMLCILSLGFFVFVRDKAYLYFSIFLLFIFLHYHLLDPRTPFINRFFPEHPHRIMYLWRVLTMGSFVFLFLFGRSFISLPKLSAVTDRLLKWFLTVWIGVAIASLIGLRYYGIDLVNNIFFYPLFLMALGFIIRMAFFKTTLARIFVAGAFWMIFWSIMGGLWNAQIITLPINPWMTAQYGQFFIYCIGLAYKVRLNEQAKAEADHIKDLDEIKSRFFANISHEFRTPLTLIRGPLQQIEEQAGNKTDTNATISVPWRKIKTMRRHTERLLELVNQLLDLSRLDSGKMKLQVARGDLMQVLKTLAASFESMAERKQIHYHLHFSEHSQLVYFDRDKLEKIVTNLLVNAFKYTPEKGSVSFIAEADEKRLRLSVEDSGLGIAKKELDKVFDRFYQSEGNEDKGTGIGLALVKELTDLYRGQISVSSEPGKGSRFRVSLPIDLASFKQNELVYLSEALNQEPYTEPEDGTAAITSKKLVASNQPLLLIVEDNSDLRNLMYEIVQHEYEVIQAVNGKEGYEKAVQEIPDIIISDVMMPLMDGFAMADKLKKDERTSHIPVILLTAKAGQSHKIEGLETGADDYLTKPFDHKELLARLRNLINQRKLLRKKFAGEIILKPSEVSVNSADENFLNKVMQAIEANLSEEKFGVEELAREVAMSRSQLHRKLIALTGQSPSEVLRNTRLLRAKELLQKKAATPSEVAYRVGFNSHTYFSKCFKEEFGVSPSEIK